MYLSVDINDLKYDNEEFVKSLDVQISKPTQSNKYFFKCNHKSYPDGISALSYSLDGSSEYGSITIEEVYNRINTKLKEWINIWNINKQNEAFTNFYSNNICNSQEEIIQFLCSTSIKEKNSSIEYYKRNITSLGNEPIRPNLIELPPKPVYNFDEEITFLNKLLFKKSSITKYQDLFNQRLSDWEHKSENIRIENEKIIESYEAEIKDFNTKSIEIQDKILKCEKDILNLRNIIDNYNQYSTEEIISVILKNLNFPFPFKNEINSEYSSENKSIVIEFLLPSPDDFYKFKSAFHKEFKTKDTELKFIQYKEKEFNDLYTNAILKSQLLIIHYVFWGTDSEDIDLITINGWVNHLDKSKGKYIDKCITSLSVTKEEFKGINLSLVEPNICFKSLRGISAHKLIEILPVAPINSISKSDNRFVQNKEVINQLNSGVNLTEMDWEDFEHLVRELFEKEFSINGGEVKITQASRDGGVDAIAFDPDPIRGGKIIIQAKRYNNVVGVSSVRDLYGTTLNEGANKGILVTTSSYGSDAYEFAKGKPLTLLNGSHLLSLLEKHGYNAHIKLKNKIT
jgi:restriction system protein